MNLATPHQRQGKAWDLCTPSYILYLTTSELLSAPGGMKNTEINIPISRNRWAWMRFDNRFKPMVLLMLLCSFLVMSTGAATDAKITIIP